MTVSDEAVTAAFEEWTTGYFCRASNGDFLRENMRRAIEAAYAIDGAREPKPVMETGTLQDLVKFMAPAPSSALRALLHGFRDVTGNFGWCLVRRAELEAALAELDALE